VEHTDAAQIAALVGALGAVLTLVPRGRVFAIVGLALWEPPPSGSRCRWWEGDVEAPDRGAGGARRARRRRRRGLPRRRSARPLPGRAPQVRATSRPSGSRSDSVTKTHSCCFRCTSSSQRQRLRWPFEC
jgi:hypothetical protein